MNITAVASVAFIVIFKSSVDMEKNGCLRALALPLAAVGRCRAGLSARFLSRKMGVRLPLIRLL